MEAYCVRCKVKREIAQGQAIFTATGTPATRGACPVCGTGLVRMGRTPAHEGLTPPPVDRARRAAARESKRRGKLVIVESPAKARTIGRYLGKGYTVRASVGHVRDLLRSQLSVDVDNGFVPKYRVPNEKKEVVKGLTADAAKAEEIFLATDPDREGEAIAWHLIEAAKIDPERARRVSFHEITQGAVKEAFEHPRPLDLHLVDAQQGRRILDRLVGYNLSPLLWTKVRSRLSAGRVQSAALRMVVDREREIQRFAAVEYWTIDAGFQSAPHPPAFRARLARHRRSCPRASIASGRRSGAGGHAERRVHGPSCEARFARAPALAAVHDQHAAAGRLAPHRLHGPQDDGHRPAVV